MAVIGGDRRSLVCAELLTEAGFECAVYGFEKEPPEKAVRAATLSDALCDCSAVVLPLPVSDGKNVFAPFAEKPFLLTDLRDALPKDALLLAGNPTDEMIRFFSGYTIANYAGDEGFMLRNRIPTAEGGLMIALEHTDRTLYGADVLVCGMGRIGRYLADILASLGAHVTVSVRKRTDRINALQHGFTVLHSEELSDCPTAFDVIFNTVPAPILGARVLKKLRGNPLLIELASKPYGVGFTKGCPPPIKAENFSAFVRLTFRFFLAIIGS